MTANI